MTNQTQDDNGNWVEATPLPPQGLLTRLEFWLRKHDFVTAPKWLAKWDEKKLGK